MFVALATTLATAIVAWPWASRLPAAPAVGALDEPARLQAAATEDDRWRPRPDQLRHERRILRELSALGGAHAWAGRYVYSDGYEGARLSLSPVAGAQAQLLSDVVGPDPRCDYALRELADGSLRLIPLHGAEACSPRVPTTLRPLRWGRRHYLIEAGSESDFVERIAQGLEPRTQRISRGGFARRGAPFLREGDELIAAEGRPDLPENLLLRLE
ncbi:hypothetical protein [Lysobacter enzymogenes]|uniref:hypothetical protein n=1 Tax=Lysobacter enzymogenes TaxID=69 RepID=UPI00111762CC|nr:hypothetical protein [Lysobacter enzymogenes]UZW59425.1 hypothetical protein BV903_019290 [Lysobacter enzymogenes]